MRLQPYPAYKPSGVPWLDDVPAHWEVKKVTHMFSIGSGTTPPTDHPEFYGGDVDWITTSELRESIVTSTQKTVTREALRLFPSLKIYPAGSVAVAMYGATIGRVGVLGTFAAVNQACCVFSDGNSMNTWFWFYWLQSRRHVLVSMGYGGGQPNLSLELLRSIRVATPSLQEQAAIVRYLDHADRRIRRYLGAKQKLIALLQEEKQAIINQAVTRGLDPNVPLKPSGVEWLGDVPAHWEVRRLKRVLSSLIDCEHKTAPAVDVSSYRVVRTSAVRGGTLLLSGTYCTSKEAFAEWTRRGSLEPGDVIFTREAPAGEACVVPSSLNLCLGQRTVLMKVDRHAYEPQFLVHMLYTGPPHDEIELASQGSTLPHFNVEDIGTLPVLAPPVLEQRAIVDWLEAETGDLTYAIGRTRRQIELLREYRTRLIADVVTGKLDVRAAAAQLPDEPDDQEPMHEGDPTEDMDGDLEEADDAAEEAVV